MNKKVFVGGCFDIIHSGHIEFFQNASKYGDLYVCIGSDNTIKELKGKYPVHNQYERKFIIDSIKFVKECRISIGTGILDFKNELKKISPDIFIVNEDGDSPLKNNLCIKNKIDYKIILVGIITFKHIKKETLNKVHLDLKKVYELGQEIDLGSELMGALERILYPFGLIE